MSHSGGGVKQVLRALRLGAGGAGARSDSPQSSAGRAVERSLEVGRAGEAESSMEVEQQRACSQAVDRLSLE